MLVPFVVPNHVLKHSFQCIIDGLDLTINLRIVGRRILMVNPWLGFQFGHDMIMKVRYKISHNLFRGTKPSDDMIKNEYISLYKK